MRSSSVTEFLHGGHLVVTLQLFVKGEDRGIICKCKAGVSVSQCVRRLGFHSMSGRTAANTCEADHHSCR